MKQFSKFLEEQRIIKESSLSRVYRQTLEFDSGTISAFRYAPDCGDGTPYVKSDNKKRSSKLKAQLLGLGYGVTKIDGTYIENFGKPNAREVKEDSYLVVDIKNTGNIKKDLIKLGTTYEQDSITFAPKGNTDYYLISSNKCPSGYPGNGKIGVELKLGKPMFGKNGEFHSKVNGRPFVFENVLFVNSTLSEYSISEIRSFVKLTGELND